MIGRRELIAQIAGTAAMSGLVSSSSEAGQQLRSSARDIGPPPARRPPASVENLRKRISLFDVMTTEQVREVRDGVSRDHTSAFAEALAAAAIVEVPAGVYRVSGLVIPGGRTIEGVGRATILAPVSGSTEGLLLRGLKSSDISVRDLVLDGENVATVSAVFTDVHRVVLSGVTVTRVRGHSLVLDGCTDSRLADSEFLNTGAVGGYAAAAIVDWTKPGHRNLISNIRGDRVTGRLIGLFSQADTLVERIDHRNVNRGEAVYFLNCLRCRMDQIVHIGGGAGQSGRPNPGNDGCAIDGGSVECTATNGLTSHNSGHGLSINGTKGYEGSSRNIVRNWTAKYCDEGGVVITDQGVVRSSPSYNRVSDCFVENPGQRVPEAAFSCFGAYDNQFSNCYARDTRPVKRMTVGYEEGYGVNGADRNVWRGSVGKGETIRSEVVRIGRNSVVTRSRWRAPLVSRSP